MCGIAGYIGPKEAVGIVFDQITRLEYRGYDSAGVAFQGTNGIGILKKAGKLVNLKQLLETEKPESHLAIAHSRWATHGGPTDENAHPHFDQNDRIAVIHNGIIENYYDLAQELAAEGHVFVSETDTEIAAHVIGREYEKSGNLTTAVREAVRRLKGAYAMVVLSVDDPDRIVAVRNASPLVLGLGEGENFLASDIPALLPYTRKVIVMDEGDLATLSREGITLEDGNGESKVPQVMIIDWDIESAEKGGFPHFMIKEIHEQPDSVRACLAGRLQADGRVQLANTLPDEDWKRMDRVIMIACGTAYHAGLMGAYLIEKMLRVPVQVEYASEFRYNDPILREGDVVVVISQSGETADTLAALKLAKSRGVPTLGVVNVVGSSIARECDAVHYLQAGPEISVASTKAYSGQVATLTLAALYAAQIRGVSSVDLAMSLAVLPDRLAETLCLEEQCLSIAKQIRDTQLMFYLGRGADAAAALEGALKMKEIAYVPTQESPAGEMKHGPLALVEPGVVAVFGATDPETRNKVVSNIKEVKARRGTVIAIGLEDGLVRSVCDEFIAIPDTGSHVLNATLSVLPMQLLAYHLAHLRGCEIDQPRNLAKSVTVE
ncbi:MAG: glutamine--fructose-6-phosphate transaminase (isomerizing) [Armatimonadota bacterium]|nr:glutamine--fructose-6-phosphate transaminase (isomerizing) [Armatimonadota bacterium]